MTTSTPLPKQVLCPVDGKPAPWVENKEKYARWILSYEKPPVR